APRSRNARTDSKPRAWSERPPPPDRAPRTQRRGGDFTRSPAAVFPSGLRGERRLEGFERRCAVRSRPRLEANRARIADVAQSLCNSRVVDLPGPRFAAPRYVGNLNLPDGVATAADQFDEVSLADLRVIEIEHHLDVRMINRFDERKGVLGAGQRDS